jgi:hypothetical protein
MMKKISQFILILLIATLTVLFFSKNSLLTSVLLILIYYFKAKYFPIRYEFFWFHGLVVSSAITEIILINFSHTWFYANPDILGIPFYPPIYWALMIVTIISLNRTITK